MSMPTPGGTGAPPPPPPPPPLSNEPQPLMPLVKFDFEAAHDMSAQLRFTANSMREMQALIEKELPFTTDSWTGSFRANFDEEAALRLLDLQNQADQLTAEATRIEALAYEAEAANQSINAQNQAIEQNNAAIAARAHFRPPA